MSFARELAIWWARRRRFADEWAFHREMAISEFESLGLDRPEARRLALRRLGTYGYYRRAALREVRADSRTLLNSLPWYGLRKSPYLVPAVVVVIVGLLLAFNPQRLQVIQSIPGLLPFAPTRTVERFVPLEPQGIIPTGFAALTLWSLAVIGMIRIGAAFSLRAYWRLWTFGAATLCLLTALGGVFWATGLQVMMKKRWPLDAIQGAALVAFLFTYVGLAFVALRFWFRDLESRCPVCLRLLGMAQVRGKAHDMLVTPLETETICLRGHGLNVESRWGRVFAPDHSTAQFS